MKILTIELENKYYAIELENIIKIKKINNSEELVMHEKRIYKREKIEEFENVENTIKESIENLKLIFEEYLLLANINKNNIPESSCTETRTIKKIKKILRFDKDLNDIDLFHKKIHSFKRLLKYTDKNIVQNEILEASNKIKKINFNKEELSKNNFVALMSINSNQIALVLSNKINIVEVSIEEINNDSVDCPIGYFFYNKNKYKIFNY